MWTPDAADGNKQAGVNVAVDSSGGKGPLDAGNDCQLRGNLVAVSGTPASRFTATVADVRQCPDVRGPGGIATITTMEGPAVNAASNAQKITVEHAVSKGRFSFVGE